MIWKKIDKSIYDDSIGKSFEETISDESSSRIKSKYLQICIIFFFFQNAYLIKIIKNSFIFWYIIIIIERTHTC